MTCDDQTFARIDAKKTPLRMPQERFSRGGGYSGIPLISSTPSSKAPFAPGDVIDNFPSDEDDVDAATPVDAQNAPTGVWKSRREREIPTAPTSIMFFLKEEEEKGRTKSKSAQTNCPPNRIRSRGSREGSATAAI
jgi:hypothetical protein